MSADPIDYSAVEDEVMNPLQFLEEQHEEPDTTQTFDETDPNFFKKKRRANGAVVYEKKARGLFQTATKITVQSSGSVADAAIIALKGPKAAVKLGDLAAVDPKIARALDFLSDGSENAYAAALAACAPIILQIIRNHEPILEPAPRAIKVPFVKRTFKVPIKIGIRLGMFRKSTHEPKHLAHYVFDVPQIRQELESQGIEIARIPD